ncbi:unnamed protein product [Linum trigynum]|uniref:Uncharacterized protein n=1 Tax=Linum trigynum TaxID=586398 RepID=A0AAV2DQG3_9ROSI
MGWVPQPRPDLGLALAMAAEGRSAQRSGVRGVRGVRGEARGAMPPKDFGGCGDSRHRLSCCCWKEGASSSSRAAVEKCVFFLGADRGDLVGWRSVALPAVLAGHRRRRSVVRCATTSVTLFFYLGDCACFDICVHHFSDMA